MYLNTSLITVISDVEANKADDPRANDTLARTALTLPLAGLFAFPSAFCVSSDKAQLQEQEEGTEFNQGRFGRA